MQRTLTSRRRTVLLSLAMVATGLVGVLPVRAQNAPVAGSDPYRVLVPMFERKGEAKADFAKKVAEAVAKSLSALPTHKPVPSSEVKETLRKYKLKEEELDCIKDRQLAVQMNAELVMCGTVEPAGGGYNITAQVIGAKTGETFELAPINGVADPAAAAAQIYAQFETYIKQLQFASFCSQYLGSQQYDLALKNCNDALAVNPNSQTVRLLAGMALYRSGMAADQSEVTDSAKLAQAMEQYKKVIELNPVNQEALRQAGIITARLGQADQSREYFKQYMELNPGDVGVRLAIAGEALKNGDPEGALRLIEDGLKVDSTSTDLLTYAGIAAITAAAKSQDRSKDSVMYGIAANYYKRVYAIKDTATDASVLQNLILADQLAGRTAEALDIGARATTIHPKEAGLWNAYAQALQAAGKNEEALRAIESGLAIDPKFKALVGRRVSLLLNAGRLEDARAAIQEAISAGTIDADDASLVVFTEGSERFRANKYDSALEYFSLARELAQSNVRKGAANFWTGMVFYQRGRAVAGTGNQTAKQARQALPIFQRALEYLQGAGVEEYAASVKANLGQTISGVKQYIDIENQYIKRGQ